MCGRSSACITVPHLYLDAHGRELLDSRVKAVEDPFAADNMFKIRARRKVMSSVFGTRLSFVILWRAVVLTCTAAVRVMIFVLA